MSKYENEHGTIKLPAGAMKAVRKAVVDAHNATRQSIFDKAVALLPKLQAESKGKRNFDYIGTVRRLTGRQVYGNDDAAEAVEALLLPYRKVEREGRETYERVKRPVKPKKKDLGLLPARTTAVRSEDACITFGDDGRTVTWSVGENNHAVERARESVIGRAFFAALSRITWTRGSGGSIVGNDEYNRDSDREGGGGNYLVEEYGPNVKKARPASSYNYFVPMRGRRF